MTTDADPGHGAESGGHDDDHLTDFQLGLLLVSVGLFLGSLTRFIQENVSMIKIPYTVVLFLIGIVLGLIEDYLGKLGLAVHEVKSIDPHLLLGAFIPALIFESAFSVNYHTISRIFIQVFHCFISSKNSNHFFVFNPSNPFFIVFYLYFCALNTGSVVSGTRSADQHVAHRRVC